MSSGSLEVRFWRYVKKSQSPEGCWVWTGGTSSSRGRGYGRVHVSAEVGMRSAHVVAFEMASGRPVEDKHVLHKCDNTLCVRYDHLFEGTPMSNKVDCIAKGRVARGSLIGTCMQNVETVCYIRARIEEGISQRALAKELGVERCRVRSALGHWKWIVESETLQPSRGSLQRDLVRSAR